MTRRKPWEIRDDLWAVIEPLLPKLSGTSITRGASGSKTARRSRACCALSTQVSGGGTYRRSWGSGPAPPAGGGGPSGRRPGCGRNSNRCCWTGYGRRAVSTSPARHRRLPRPGQAGAKQPRSQPQARLTCTAGLEASRAARRPRHPRYGVSLTGGHRHDVTQLLPLIDRLGPVRGKQCQPRTLHADCGYAICRRLRKRGITPKFARRAGRGSGPGKVRWVAESAIAWLQGPRHLRIRWEIPDDMYDAFLQPLDGFENLCAVDSE